MSQAILMPFPLIVLSVKLKQKYIKKSFYFFKYMFFGV